ncbi:MAG: type II toxin-antitoxin system prevent-host-death family antitoxin, partial [Betaproteobacteria bacterium]|nr:type II toxin-antitoxin system prevent-host-death family antitoxin [Betaproteobacteria bacterium]
MSEVNITELRQNLPEYLAEVRKGKELRVTVRG